MIFRTRFAPSPTGPLHLGHAYSALLAHDLARAAGGLFHLRIEDIDQSRARHQWEAQIYDDLRWLGVTWASQVLRQSDRVPLYRAALERLSDLGLLYPCWCSRRDIQSATTAPQEGADPTTGPDGLIYPGTCRDLGRKGDPVGAPALRLHMERAVDLLTARGTPWPMQFQEDGMDLPNGVHLHAADAVQKLGDIVLARRDMGTSYHLSVVLDDAAQGITHVVRGRDLFEATKIHIILQALLALPTPVYHHHRLIRDAQGKRLAKRDDARAISTYRDAGFTPADLRALVDLPEPAVPAR